VTLNGLSIGNLIAAAQDSKGRATIAAKRAAFEVERPRAGQAIRHQWLAFLTNLPHLFRHCPKWWFCGHTLSLEYVSKPSSRLLGVGIGLRFTYSCRIRKASVPQRGTIGGNFC
jgi:hypothetical protein